ncbi:hypothetical protein [Streptomyces virginiae]|uniref:hypothetical protein n=1 Tax=Streptomyces virginiae TaxID=1961 RepID=UPI0034175F28
MNANPDSIAESPDSRMLLIPAGDPGFSLGVALWDDADDVYRSFVRSALSEGWEKRVFRAAVGGRSEKGLHLPVVVQLVPRPDNDYNPKAISVAAPAPLAGTAHERHMGYMYDRNLVSLGGPLRGLASVADRPVGCHALVELLEADDRWDEHEEEAGEEQSGDCLRIPGATRRYTATGSLRLRLPWWEDLQTMVVEYARRARPGLVMPFIGHWMPYRPGAHAELLRRTDRKEFPVTLRVANGALLAYYEDLELSVLVPSGRDFFARTMRQVQAMGGTATARAEEHRGALKVLVEDSRGVL